MRRTLIAAAVALCSAAAAAQTPITPGPVVAQFVRYADIYGASLVAAFDSIPADKYGYRPTPVQRSIGDIAQHLETANYGLCGRVSTLKHTPSAKDSVAEPLKAQWPKDTLIARLRASLRFCDASLETISTLDSPAIAYTLIGFETDLAEHYSQVAGYMRELGLVPPTALPAPRHVEIALPQSAIDQYVGAYELSPGTDVVIARGGNVLTIRITNSGGAAIPLRAEAQDAFFTIEVPGRVTFSRDAGGRVAGLVLHLYDRDRPAKKIP